MQAQAQHLKMSKIFVIIHALIALTVADVSHLNLGYLPPIATTQHIADGHQAQPQQQIVQLDKVLSDEAINENANAITDVQQSLDNESGSSSSDESASDPSLQPGFGGFGSPQAQGYPMPTIPYPGYAGQFIGQSYSGQGFIFPGQRYTGLGNPSLGFPGQGFPGQGFPGQGFPGQGFPGQGFPGQGFPGQGFPGIGFPGQVFPGQGFQGQGFQGQGFPGQGFQGQAFPGQGFPGQGFPGQGFPGLGFPGQGLPGQGFPSVGFAAQAGGFPLAGFPGVTYQTNNQEKPSGFNASPTSGTDIHEPSKRIASDTVYGANGGYVYDKPN